MDTSEKNQDWIKAKRDELIALGLTTQAGVVSLAFAIAAARGQLDASVATSLLQWNAPVLLLLIPILFLKNKQDAEPATQ